ncbi:hypothetical protein NP493_1532g01010 [Ridgeia piscesae]|uniref:Uncharacterized protein n=1 Tax=Ridgeia piscesae TaxID=27915 RepID=A0AAD9NBP2_RIDPI|nr:hypothetical protein NP493_1532g01010 [Ridgeia piscesae]
MSISQHTYMDIGSTS